MEDEVLEVNGKVRLKIVHSRYKAWEIWGDSALTQNSKGKKSNRKIGEFSGKYTFWKSTGKLSQLADGILDIALEGWCSDGLDTPEELIQAIESLKTEIKDASLRIEKQLKECEIEI